MEHQPLEFYAVGGRQREGAVGREEWHHYERGVVVRIDATGAGRVCFDYVSPPDACPAGDQPSFLFKAATVRDNRIYLCTQTEVLICALPSFERMHYVSLPCFNDLHHVRPTSDGTLIVVSTGLDLVVEVSLEGEVLREWGVMGQDPWSRFSRAVDYRKVFSTKPHVSHPNFSFFLGGELWVTRFKQRDAVCLTRPGGRLDVAVQGPHDGYVLGDKVVFTTVDGHLVVASPGRVPEVIDLNGIGGSFRRLGWCRAALPLDERRVVVGFSRLRATKPLDNIGWLRGGIEALRSVSQRPTRLALYDTLQRELCWEVSLEELGLSAVFSCHLVGAEDP